MIARLAILLCAVVTFSGLVTGCATTAESESLPEGTLKVGWGRRSIAMPGPMPIVGQFNLRVSQGQFTPVLAEALALEDGKDAVVFVCCDVTSVDPVVLEDVRETLKKEIPGFPVEKLIISATHTHAGPATYSVDISYPNKMKIIPPREVQIFLARQIADAVKEAWEKRASGAVAYGYGFATTGHNRRVIYSEDIGLREAGRKPGIAVNGHGKMYGKTNDPLFSHFETGADPYINLLYTFDLNGKLTGAVINVPCPAQTNEWAWALYASFWDNVRRKLHAKYGDIGIIGQAAGAGDMAPRQLYYLDAEKRRYKLKYEKEIADYVKNPMPRYVKKGDPPPKIDPESREVIEHMRAEDIASRIVAAFDEVLSWAAKEKFTSPVLRHEVRTIKLARRLFPEELVEEEKRKYKTTMRENFLTEGDEYTMLLRNSRLASRRKRLARVTERQELQQKEPDLLTDIHAVRIGDIAFASNRFELFIDFMHRIQARSPFTQTFIVQLTADPRGRGTYLATERALKNKGYSASPYCNQVSPEGGQQLVEETLKSLTDISK